jgi:hypothetical protein
MDVSAVECSAVFNINQPQVIMIPGSIFASSCFKKDYFNHLTNPCYDNEKKMFANIATEMWNQQGVKLIYYKVDYNTSYDKLYGEDRDRHIERQFPFQGYFILPTEEELMTLFGIDVKDIFKIYVAKQHFEVASTLSNTGCGVYEYDPYEPCEGDIIKGKWNDTFYEVIEVKDSEGTMLQTKLAWTLIVRIFRDNHFSVNEFQPPIPSVKAKELEISAVTDKPTDILQINEEIDEEKEEFLFNTSAANEEPINPDPYPPVNDDPFGGW